MLYNLHLTGSEKKIKVEDKYTNLVTNSESQKTLKAEVLKPYRGQTDNE